MFKFIQNTRSAPLNILFMKRFCVVAAMVVWTDIYVSTNVSVLWYNNFPFSRAFSQFRWRRYVQNKDCVIEIAVICIIYWRILPNNIQSPVCCQNQNLGMRFFRISNWSSSDEFLVTFPNNSKFHGIPLNSKEFPRMEIVSFNPMGQWNPTEHQLLLECG